MPVRPSLPGPTALRTALLLLVLPLLASQLMTTPAAGAAEPVVAPPAIVAFDDWAPAACPRPTGKEPSPTRRLVVHHTHEPVAHTPAEVLPALALTCKAHTDRGFSSIGYHYVVDPWGGIYQGRGGLPQAGGRPPATQPEGAHVAGTNAGAVGVVFLGDHEDEPPTAAALEAATHLLAWLLEATGHDPSERVPVDSTGAGTARQTGRFNPRAMTGHSASNHTACPGEHLRELLPRISDRMRQLLAGQQPDGWDGLAVDRPAPTEQPAQAKKPTDSAAPKARKLADSRGGEPATAEPAAQKAVDVAERTPLGLGPLASPVQRLARGLREVGLLSLAERISGPSHG